MTTPPERPITSHFDRSRAATAQANWGGITVDKANTLDAWALTALWASVRRSPVGPAVVSADSSYSGPSSLADP
jgi:hypothetical protein